MAAIPLIWRKCLNAVSVSGVLLGAGAIAAVVLGRWSAQGQQLRVQAALDAIERHQERLRVAMTCGQAATFEWNAATNEHEWSDEMYRLYGVDRQGFANTYEGWLSLVLPEYREAVNAAVGEALKKQHLRLDFPIRRASDGQIRWIASEARVELDEQGAPASVVGVNTDITERKLGELALLETERRLQLAVEIAELGTWEYDVQLDCLRIAPDWKKRLQLEQLVDTPSALLDRVHRDDREKALSYFTACLQQPSLPHSVEFRLCQGDESYRWINCRAISTTDERGRVVRLFGTHLDITARKEAEQRIKEESLHDPLTGLPNRALLMEYAGHVLSAAERSRGTCALLFIDLDRFKPINDQYGHDAGDAVLEEVAQRLRGCTRYGDVVARLGGDEFAVLLAQSDVERRRADVVSAHILEAVAKPIRFGAQELSVSPSVGIAYFPEQAGDIESLIQKADLAMYEAKHSGRAGCQTYRDGLAKPAEEAAQRECRIRQALKEGTLQLYYQPILALRDGTVVAAEALIRLTTEEGRVVGPAAFMPESSSLGIAEAIDAWVLHTACRQQAQWLKAGIAPPLVSINISSANARQSTFPINLRAVLAETEVDPGRIQIELSARAVEPEAEGKALVEQLKAAGVKVSLDGFGSSPINLAQLTDFAFDRIKLERNVVRRATGEGSVAALPRLMIALATVLKLNVVWEGVESRETFDFLREAGIGEVQGYLFSRPLPADKFEQWCTGRQRFLH